MPMVLTPKRIRRSLYALRLRARNARQSVTRPRRPPWVYDALPRRTGPEWEEPDDDLEGGAGVREPRHPLPTMPTMAVALEEPEPQHLDLTG